MTRWNRAVARLTERDVPTLASFAAGYLHQDLLPEYGDVLRALAAFYQDASAEERAALVRELEQVQSASRRWLPAQLAHFFRSELQSAWTPKNREDLDRLLTVRPPTTP
jgi:hypothetical protein